MAQPTAEVLTLVRIIERASNAANGELTAPFRTNRREVVIGRAALRIMLEETGHALTDELAERIGVCSGEYIARKIRDYRRHLDEGRWQDLDEVLADARGELARRKIAFATTPQTMGRVGVAFCQGIEHIIDLPESPRILLAELGAWAPDLRIEWPNAEITATGASARDVDQVHLGCWSKVLKAWGGPRWDLMLIPEHGPKLRTSTRIASVGKMLAHADTVVVVQSRDTCETPARRKALRELPPSFEVTVAAPYVVNMLVWRASAAVGAWRRVLLPDVDHR